MRLPPCVPSTLHRPNDTSYSDLSAGTSSLNLHVLVAIAIVPFITLRTLSNASPHSTLPYNTSCPLAILQSAVSLVSFRNRLGGPEQPDISIYTVYIVSPPHREPALIFPFTRPTEACLKTHARHSSYSSSLSFAHRFPLTLSEKRSFSNFGTRTFEAFPILYTSTFSQVHLPHADFDVRCDSSSGSRPWSFDPKPVLH